MNTIKHNLSYLNIGIIILIVEEVSFILIKINIKNILHIITVQ